MFAYHYRSTTPEVKYKNQQNTIRRPVFLLYLKILHLKSPKTCLTAGFLVRPSGFEPLAYRVGVCHSIQLSYGRIFSRSYYSKVRPKSKADFLFPFAVPDARCIQVQMRSPRRRKRPLAFDSKAVLSFRKCRDCNPRIYLIKS